MILMTVLGILIVLVGMYSVYAGEVITGVIYIAVGNLYLDVVSDKGELKHIRSELKLLQASQHHR